MHPTRGSGHAGRIDSILKREFPGQELYTVKTPALNGRLCTYPQASPLAPPSEKSSGYFVFIFCVFLFKLAKAIDSNAKDFHNQNLQHARNSNMFYNPKP